MNWIRKYICLSFFFVWQYAYGQNLSVLHYNLFTSKDNPNIVSKKSDAVESLLKGVEADLYSFTEDPYSKTQYKNTIYQDLIQEEYYGHLIAKNNNYYHSLLFNKSKLSFIEKKNIRTKNKPVVFYQFNYQTPQIGIAQLNCFIIYSKNAGEDLIGYLNHISNFIYDTRLNGYNLVLGGAQNILIDDIRKLRNSSLSNYKEIQFFELKRYALSSDKFRRKFTPGFDIAIVAQNDDSDDKKLRFVPNSYTQIEEGSESLYIDITSELTNTLNQATAHIPLYFELELSYHQEVIIKKERLQFNKFIKNELKIEINWGQETLLTVQLLSVIGNVVYQTSFVCPSDLYMLDISTHSLAPGFYFLKVKTAKEEIIDWFQKAGS